MGLADWYHDRLIRKLQQRWGDIPARQVRGNYFDYKNKTSMFLAAVADGRLDLDYGIDIAITVEESVPERFGRAVVIAIDNLFGD